MTKFVIRHAAIKMNVIEVTGGKQAERDIVEYAVHWYVKKIMPRFRTLDIEISIKKLNDAYGYCFCNSTRSFEIDLKKGLTLYELIATTCHEMTHLKQYATGELKEVNYGAKWKGRLFKDSIQYSKQPWEKEAFKTEKELAFQCFKEIDFTF